jgi:XRE family transcriptional regulator, regulator of sulfur utilization
MNIGATIRKIRKSERLNLTQGELAKIVDIPQTTLSLIEGKNKLPREKTLLRLADVLGVPLPIIYCMSINESDIPENKREYFLEIKPMLDMLCEEYLINE